MDFQVLTPSGDHAETEDEVGSVRVSFEMRNVGGSVVRFPAGEVVLEVTRDNEPYVELEHRRGPRELYPGESFVEIFEFEVVGDGAYGWIGKTWYYER